LIKVTPNADLAAGAAVSSVGS